MDLPPLRAYVRACVCVFVFVGVRLSNIRQCHFFLLTRYAHANSEYARGYAESADARVAPFRRRSIAFRTIAYTAMGSIAYVVARLIARKVT